MRAVAVAFHILDRSRAAALVFVTEPVSLLSSSDAARVVSICLLQLIIGDPVWNQKLDTYIYKIQARWYMARDDKK